jgi:hypothetical protein
MSQPRQPSFWSVTTRSLRELPFGARLIVIVATIALVLHVLGAEFDGIALALLALALSPWITTLVEKFKFGDFEISLRVRQEWQQDQIDAAIRSLVKTVVKDYHFQHLKNLARDGPYYVKLHDAFRKELYDLIEMGLINRKPARGIRTLFDSEAPHNVKDHFEISDAGRKFLEIRDAILQEENREREGQD